MFPVCPQPGRLMEVAPQSPAELDSAASGVECAPDWLTIEHPWVLFLYLLCSLNVLISFGPQVQASSNLFSLSVLLDVMFGRREKQLQEPPKLKFARCLVFDKTILGVKPIATSFL
jgi:hypothetical protein